MPARQLSRRRLLGHGSLIAASGLLLPVLGGCSRNSGDSARLSCSDTSTLSTSEGHQRQSFEYVDSSPFGEGKRCGDCRFFQPAGDDSCGRCMQVKGPIHPSGYCTLWSVRPA